MKHVHVLAGSLIIALACLMFASTAVSQIQKRETPEHPTKHQVVRHPRSRARVSLRAPVRHRVEKKHPEPRHEERH